MPFTATTYSRRTYGVSSIEDERNRSTNETSQAQAETLSVSATANNRRFRMPRGGGHFSLHTRVGSASGATSALTVWYSNLPNPDVTDDTHWVQDTSITAIDLTVANTTYFHNVGNVYAEWIRIKPVVASSAGTMYQWLRVEGAEIP